MYILVLNSVYKICLSEPFHKVPMGFWRLAAKNDKANCMVDSPIFLYVWKHFNFWLD